MSVESYGFKFVVDAKDAAKGYGDFQKAVDGVFASLDRFEQHAKKVMDSVTSSSKKGQSDIARYAAQFKSLANIPIDNRAAPALLKLSDAMARFKAPNTTQISNMRTFFRTLGTLPDLSAATRSISNIAKLSAAMSGFKAPSAGQAEKLVLFAKALQQVGPGLASLSRVAGVSGIANELASVSIALGKLRIPSASQAANLQNFARSLQMMRIGGAGGMAGMLHSLASINGFKAPSAAQTRNLVQFVQAVNGLKVPANAGQIATYLQHIATAATSANSSLKNFRGSLNSISWGGFNSGASKARLEMMGLQNAFSGTFQVGSLLRSLLGSLTIGELGRAFFNANQTANQFHATMEVLGQTPMMQAAEWERVRSAANHFGADLNTYAEDFSKFAVAAHESGMSLSESFKVFEGFQNVETALHLPNEQRQSVGLAIREIMDQGYVSTQRLTRQLGLVLPGALATLQKAWKEHGTPGINLFDALKKKMVDGQWALDQLADHYTKVYGPAVKAALESPIQQFNILKNNIMDLMVQIGNDGAKKAFADFIAKLSGGLDPSHMKAFAEGISKGLVTAIHRAGAAVDWLKANWDALKGPIATVLSLMGKWMVISAAFKIGAAIVGPLISARRAFVGFNTTMVESVAQGGRVRTMLADLTKGVQPLPTGFGRLNASAVAATAGMNTLRVGMNGLKAAGSGLMSLFGGPLGVTLLALGALVGGVASHIMSAKIQVNDMTASVNDALQPMHDADAILRQMAQSSAAAGNGVGGVGNAASNASPFLQQCGKDAGTAADKFFRLAMGARSAMVAMTNQKIMELQQENVTAQKMTTRGAYDDLYRGNFTSIKDFVGRVGNKLSSAATKIYDNGETDRNLVNSIAKNNGAIQQLLSYRTRLFNMTNQQIVAIQNNGMEPPPAVTDPIYHGIDGSAKKKKKGPNPTKQLESMENGVSTMMDKLMDGDPVGKLYSEFVQTLTKEGQTLLNDKSYHQFIANLTTDAKTGKVSVEALIDQLEKGGGKKKVLDDIAKRYGVDVKQIIAMLRTEQSDYYRNVQEATTKAIDTQHKAANDIMKRFAEDDPLLKLQQDYTDDLVVQAEKLLNNASFKQWYDLTASGAEGAATATERLITALKDASNYNPDAVKGLAAYGKTIGKDGVSMVQHSQSVNQINTVETTRKLTFGEDLLRQGREQLSLGLLSDQQQAVANKLLEEYNRLRVTSHAPDQAHIDALKQQLLLQERQLDLLQQQKEFYQNNGIKTYLADIKTAGEFVHEFDNTFLKGLEDTLYTLGTTGKLSFKNLFDSMQSSIIRFASQGITSKLATLLNPHAMSGDDKNPTMFGFLGKMLGGKKGNDFQQSNKSIIEQSEITPMRVFITNTGELGFGQGSGIGGGSAFGGLFGDGTNPTDADISTDPFSAMGDLMGLGPDGSSPIGDAVSTSVSSAMTNIQPNIQNMFNQTFKTLGGSFGSIFQQLLGGIGGGGGGGGMGGGIMSLLGGLLGGGGGGGGAAMSFMDDTAMLAGFMEGGLSTSPVGRRYAVSPAAFFNAPHYAEGTSNTSGIPAVLHDNEAVIPLSRGRKVPVELTGMSSSANGGTNVTNNFNIQSPDADSFRKSKSQIAVDLHTAGVRSFARNR